MDVDLVDPAAPRLPDGQRQQAFAEPAPLCGRPNAQADMATVLTQYVVEFMPEVRNTQKFAAVDQPKRRARDESIRQPNTVGAVIPTMENAVFAASRVRSSHTSQIVD